MNELDFRRVQKNARGRGAVVKRIAKNRKTVFARVDTDLMRATGSRLRLKQF